MSVHQGKTTYHANKRAKQRDVNPVFSAARKYGLNSTEIFQALGNTSELGKYVFGKEHYRSKAVRVYQESIYIFPIHSNRCITCYKLPDELMEEYNKLKMVFKAKKQYAKACLKSPS